MRDRSPLRSRPLGACGAEDRRREQGVGARLPSASRGREARRVSSTGLLREVERIDPGVAIARVRPHEFAQPGIVDARLREDDREALVTRLIVDDERERQRGRGAWTRNLGAKTVVVDAGMEPTKVIGLMDEIALLDEARTAIAKADYPRALAKLDDHRQLRGGLVDEATALRGRGAREERRAYRRSARSQCLSGGASGRSTRQARPGTGANRRSGFESVIEPLRAGNRTCMGRPSTSLLFVAGLLAGCGDVYLGSRNSPDASQKPVPANSGGHFVLVAAV